MSKSNFYLFFIKKHTFIKRRSLNETYKYWKPTKEKTNYLVSRYTMNGGTNVIPEGTIEGTKHISLEATNKPYVDIIVTNLL